MAGGLRRRSVQVCDVHRRLKDMSIEVGEFVVCEAMFGGDSFRRWLGEEVMR